MAVDEEVFFFCSSQFPHSVSKSKKLVFIEELPNISRLLFSIVRLNQWLPKLETAPMRLKMSELYIHICMYVYIYGTCITRPVNCVLIGWTEPD